MSSGIVRELSNVRHVLELKRSLIFLSMLDKVGCSIRVKFSVLKAIKRSTVLIKVDMPNGLYLLYGTAIFRDVGIAKNQFQDKTLLWLWVGINPQPMGLFKPKPNKIV